MVKEINIRELYLLLKKRLWIIVLLTVLATGAGYYQNSTTETLLYQSSSRIIVGANADYMKTLMVIMKDPVIMEKVANELTLSRSPEALSRQIAVDSINSSQVVRITVTDTDPILAANIANKTASVFKNNIGNIVNFNDVNYLSEARVNEFPINVKSNRTIYIAGMMGFILSIGFVFLLNSLDDTVRSQREIEELIELPILGTVSKMSKRNINKVKPKQIEIKDRGDLVDLNKTQKLVGEK